MEFKVEWTKDPPSELPGDAPSHFQVLRYGDLMRRYGQEPMWQIVRDETGRLVSAWLLAKTSSDYLYPSRLGVLRKLDVHIEGSHGPVVSPDLVTEERRSLAAFSMRAVIDKAQRERALRINLRMHPLSGEGRAKGWKESASEAGFRAVDVATYITDIKGDSPEQLFGRIKGDRRTKIRKAEELGVEVRRAESSTDVQLFTDLRNAARTSIGLTPIPDDHYLATYEVLGKAGLYSIFLATLDGRLAAGQTAFAHNGYIYLAANCHAEWTREKKVPANDFLQWRVLEWAATTGNRFVDFVGAEPTSTDPKVKAIDSFKARWASQLISYEDFVWEGPRLRSQITSVFRRLENKMRRSHQ